MKKTGRESYFLFLTKQHFLIDYYINVYGKQKCKIATELYNLKQKKQTLLICINQQWLLFDIPEVFVYAILKCQICNTNL